jgi:tetratricopeptide (TPR) repeat protein
MTKPDIANDSADGSGRGTGKRNTQRALDARILVGTVATIAVLALAAYLWRGYQVRRTAAAITERAEDLAKEKHFAAAASYYARYLELCPEDANARLRRAELFELAVAGQGGVKQAIELYQEALRPASQGLVPERQFTARRRLTELLLQANEFAAAENEAEKLRELEMAELADKPAQWRWPGLKALALAGKFREKDSAVPRTTIEEAFAEVLEPEKVGKPVVYKDPDVCLARYEYRLQQKLPNADEDLAAALKLAPANSKVLLMAAAAARRDGAEAAQSGNGEKARESYSKAIGYYRRAIEAAPADHRAYEGLGQFYTSRGDIDRAIQTWQRGLKEVAPESECIGLNLNLSDALIQQGRLADAESVLKTLDRAVTMLDPKARLSLQRLVDLRRAKLLLLRGRYDEAVRLVADLAAGKELIQGAGGMAAAHATYEAWMVLGASHAGLKHWDQALDAYQQAALLEPHEPAPRLAAARACETAARLDSAIVSYQQALAIVNAAKPTPEAQRQAIYERLAALLDRQKRTAEADRYRTLGKEQMAESTRLTLQGVGQAIRDGKLAEALAIAQRGVESRPNDPWVHVALGLARRANKDNAKAIDAYRQAVAVSKGDPQVQMVVAELLLQGNVPSEAAEAEKLLGDLMKKCDPRQEAQLCQTVGDIYQWTGQYAAAERWYRRLVKIAPDGYERLAMSLAKQGRTQDAVTLCDEAAKTDKSARPARRLAGVLVSGQATAEDLKRAEPLLQKALQNYKDDIVLMANVANVRVIEGRPDEAIELYRQIVQRQPRSPEMLNNLASLLSEGPEPEKRKEAMEYIEQAIELSGPQADWLDTKGLILVYDGKAEQAVGLLKQAASAPRPDPRSSFHLAIAYARLGDTEKARAALKQARAGDLDHQLLTKMDRQQLADLEKKVGL